MWPPICKLKISLTLKNKLFIESICIEENHLDAMGCVSIIKAMRIITNV
jgi:hypothetical protein